MKFRISSFPIQWYFFVRQTTFVTNFFLWKSTFFFRRRIVNRNFWIISPNKSKKNETIFSTPSTSLFHSMEFYESDANKMFNVSKWYGIGIFVYNVYQIHILTGESVGGANFCSSFRLGSWLHSFGDKKRRREQSWEFVLGLNYLQVTAFWDESKESSFFIIKRSSLIQTINKYTYLCFKQLFHL